MANAPEIRRNPKTEWKLVRATCLRSPSQANAAAIKTRGSDDSWRMRRKSGAFRKLHGDSHVPPLARSSLAAELHAGRQLHLCIGLIKISETVIEYSTGRFILQINQKTTFLSGFRCSRFGCPLVFLIPTLGFLLRRVLWEKPVRIC